MSEATLPAIADMQIMPAGFTKIGLLDAFIGQSFHRFYPEGDGRKGLAAYHAGKAILSAKRRKISESARLAEVRAALKQWDLVVTLNTETWRIRIRDNHHNRELFI